MKRLLLLVALSTTLSLSPLAMAYSHAEESYTEAESHAQDEQMQDEQTQDD